MPSLCDGAWNEDSCRVPQQLFAQRYRSRWCVTVHAVKEVLESPAPAITSTEAAAIADRWFGINGQAVPLGGERDANFLLVDVACWAVHKFLLFSLVICATKPGYAR